jgi:tripartite-type tricarboxylate transporter receptor subunit TctC
LGAVVDEQSSFLTRSGIHFQTSNWILVFTRITASKRQNMREVILKMMSGPLVQRTLSAVTLFIMVAAAGPASAAVEAYPTRPIRFIVGFAPGGIADLIARSLGQKMTEAWGQQVIIDNRSGGGGVISMQLAASAPRDGYTLLMGSSTQFSINPGLRSVPYDPVREYTPITQAALTPVILTVHPSFPARSVQELIQLAKAKPGNVMSYGSTGYGAAPHISAELLKRTAGINITHVPYKGGSEAVSALLGGHLQMSFGAVSTSLGHVKAGRLRALGVTSAKRLAATPDVPTFAETGLPGFEVVQWFGVFTPAGVSSAVVHRLNEELVRALASAQFKEQFAAQGIELMSSTPDAFAAYVKAELVRWTRVLKEIGVQEAP